MGKRNPEEIASETFLSVQQAEILLLKQQGNSHEQIAEELGLEKGSVDSQSSRMNNKYEKAKQTVAEIKGEQLHDRATLSDGTPIGKKGVTWQMLDETDRGVGEIFHVIVSATDGYYGKLGATWSKITRYGEVKKEGIGKPEGVDIKAAKDRINR